MDASSHLEPIKVREHDARGPARLGAARVLKTLHKVAACGSFGAATQAVQAPEALAAPLPLRTRRQMRTARVSWW